MAEMSKKHGMNMFQKGDEKHINAMKKMMGLMKDSNAMKKWMTNKKKEFDSLNEEK